MKTQQQPLAVIHGWDRRYWQLYREQVRRGRDAVEAKRVAHLKLGKEIQTLSDVDRANIMRAIRMSE